MVLAAVVFWDRWSPYPSGRLDRFYCTKLTMGLFLCTSTCIRIRTTNTVLYIIMYGYMKGTAASHWNGLSRDVLKKYEEDLSRRGGSGYFNVASPLVIMHKCIVYVCVCVCVCICLFGYVCAHVYYVVFDF